MKNLVNTQYQGKEQVMDSVTLDDIVKKENIYNGVILATVRDNVIVDISIEKKGVYKRKKASN
tara:strand:- start:1715 stop:1903 length:189 start_codon:yes stop_codon:yes gene_type:complete